MGLRMTLLLRTIAGLAVAAAVATQTPASAQDFTSLYSSTAARNCKKVDAAKEGEGDWSVWLCPGIGGYVVRVTEDDLRMTVSIGRTLEAAAKEPASKHQFAPFNNVHDTIEWRLSKGQPFATIHRWYLADAKTTDKTGKPDQLAMLVVTRLNPACHAAYVDVHANAIANVMARQAADAQARSFDCNNPPAVIGKRGRAIDLAMP